MNTVFIESNNYDFYNLELPFNVFFKGKKNIRSWVVSNLERLHPRFLQQCDCDYKIVLQKLKLFAKILVVDKILLLTLQSQKTKRIGIKQKKNQYFFGKQNFALTFAILFVLSAFLTGTWLLKTNTSSSQIFGFENSTFSEASTSEIVLETNIPKDNSLAIQNENLLAAADLNAESINTISLLFKELLDTKIIVQTLDIVANKSFVSLNLSVLNVFPNEILAFFEENGFFRENKEILENAKVDHNSFFLKEVSYSDNVPQSNVKAYIPFDFSIIPKTDFSLESIILPNLRQNIILQNGIVKSENLNKLNIQFSLPDEHFSSFINNKNLTTNFCVSQFSLDSQNKDLAFSVNLSESGLPATLFFNNTVEKIFNKTAKYLNSQKTLNQIAEIDEQKIETEKAPTKIILGKITDSTGQKLLLIKSVETGKIYKEVQNEKE